MEKYADLTEKIIGAAMRVHRVLGPGFLESVYKRALALELTRNGLDVQIEKSLKVITTAVLLETLAPTC